MGILNATVLAADANSYLSLDRSIEVAQQYALYASSWESATGPTAEDYLVGVAGAPIGATTVPVDSGIGTFEEGNYLRLGTDTTLYKTTAAVASGATSIAVEPALIDPQVMGAAVTRVTASQREKALLMATYLIDHEFDWKGVVRTAEQALRWPRAAVHDLEGYPIDYDTLPFEIELFTMFLANELLERDRLSQSTSAGAGVKSAKLGPLQVVLDSSDDVIDAVPDSIWTLVRPWLIVPLGYGNSTVPLVRV